MKVKINGFTLDFDVAPMDWGNKERNIMMKWNQNLHGKILEVPEDENEDDFIGDFIEKETGYPADEIEWDEVD